MQMIPLKKYKDPGSVPCMIFPHSMFASPDAVPYKVMLLLLPCQFSKSNLLFASLK